MKTRDSFSSNVIKIIQHQAAFICSNPECRRMTLAPSRENEELFQYAGEVAHIIAASEGGPRYDNKISKENRESISNAIFLCSFCATLIDKNKGIDYPPALLHEWKLKHSNWVLGNLNKSTNEIEREKIEYEIDADIILELASMSHQQDLCDWNNCDATLETLEKHARNAGKQAVYEILSFLTEVSANVRADMPLSTAKTIYRLATSFFPYSYRSNDKIYDNETGNICLNIGNSIAYDAAIYLRKISYIPYGLNIWKLVFRFAKKTDNEILINQINEMYRYLENTLQRPERNDLSYALEIVGVFKNDLHSNTLAFPPYPKHIEAMIKHENS
jgi:hypothetical protein